MPGRLLHATRIGTCTIDGWTPKPLIRHPDGTYALYQGDERMRMIPAEEIAAAWPVIAPSGRPLAGTEPLYHRNVTLADSDMAAARKMGAGNVSLGLRKALATCAAMGLVA